MAIVTAIEWKRARRGKSGSRYWESRCGRYRVNASEMCYGVVLRPIIYWAWADGRRLGKFRKRQRALAACEKHGRAR